MVLEIVKYGDPVLRQRGARIEGIAAEVAQLAADMLDTMRAARGVGLAAQQVGRACQLTVLDVRGIEDRPSTLEWEGKSVVVDEFMPLVLLNPEVKALGDPVAGPEGCLSFPELYAEISRPDQIEVKAQDRNGRPVHFRCTGLLARAIQHELDHLRGILFIDRMSAEKRAELKPELDLLQAETRFARKRKAAALR